MSDNITVKPTPTERETSRLRMRFDAHIREWWPRHDADFSRKDYNYHIEDAPYQLWSCELSGRRRSAADAAASGGDSEAVTLSLLWDKKEVTSFDHEGEAYDDLINGQKARLLDSKFRYWTSPLTISALLAVMLLMLISAPEFFRHDVPDQLWSIFTAVVAFYFGRESSRRRTGQPTDESESL